MTGARRRLQPALLPQTIYENIAIARPTPGRTQPGLEAGRDFGKTNSLLLNVPITACGRNSARANTTETPELDTNSRRRTFSDHRPPMPFIVKLAGESQA